MAPQLIVQDVRPWGGDACDVVIDDGVIERLVAPGTSGEAERTIAGGGMLALPTIVNAHAHVDKSWWGLPWESYAGDGGVDGRIRHERAERDRLGIPSVGTARTVLEQMVRHGTTLLRTHVDVDLGIELRGIEAVREAVASFDGAVHAEIVAFPQDGVLRRPGVLELLERAAASGVEHVGGLDPATIDRDPVGQIDALLGIVERHGCGLDIHLHDPAALGAFQIELLVDRVARLGLHGKVNIAHGFAVAEVDAARRRDLLQSMGEVGMSMTTVAPLRTPQLPVDELDEAGVALGLGTDGIRDLWSPYGTGDTLGIAWQLARASSIVRDDGLLRVVELATRDGARLAGRAVHDIVAGAPADLVLVEAEHAPDALVRTPPRRLVVGGGRVLHEG